MGEFIPKKDSDLNAFDNKFNDDMALYDEMIATTGQLTILELSNFMRRMARAGKRTKRAVKKIKDRR